ncbi:MAG TPA: substrate-binding domain-containing protein, partial [Actinomycetota bacterium]|nr:substrate-binding domain-containing protein [Actinomycetota bacterium]
MRWLTSLLLIMSACSSPKVEADARRDTFVIASTTSTQDSGILESLVPAFEKQFPRYSAKVVAVGSGEAMQLGAKGDADVLLVHAPPDEEEFMKTGKGLYRRAVMSNSFAIAGPDSDPAKIRGVSSAEEAFQKIAATSSTFLSRGDRSGTHKKELKIWRSISTEPSGSWYLESGQGMGETITIAS